MDIIILVLGVLDFLKVEMVKDDVVVIDVGIICVLDENYFKGYVIKGDVDFENVSKKVLFIILVLGGVGFMIIVMLFKNMLLVRE